jgi:hypothetical protein
MKSKNSSGLDGLTQKQMIAGAEILAVPLTRIINTSIKEGIFPTKWKEGVVTPVLKKEHLQTKPTTDWLHAFQCSLKFWRRSSVTK